MIHLCAVRVKNYNQTMKKLSIIIFPAFILLAGFFTFPENVNAQSCNSTEWNSLKQKYSLEEQFFRMQEVVDTSPFNQTLYDSLKRQYDQSSTLAERECDAIGADKADQLKMEQMKLDSSSEIQRLEEKKWQLEDEERKLLWMEYERALENTCPSNSRLVGDSCYCNSGYVNNGSACVVPTFSPTAKPKVLNAQTDKNELKVVESTPTSAPKNETVSAQEKSTPETNAGVVEKPQGIIARIFGTVKNFFSRLFKL